MVRVNIAKLFLYVFKLARDDDTMYVTEHLKKTSVYKRCVLA